VSEDDAAARRHVRKTLKRILRHGMRAKGLERMGKDEVDGTHSTSEKIGQ